jgi:predicted O-methyltransferase YrrM
LLVVLPLAANAAEVEELDQFLVELEQYGREHNMMNVPPDHGRFLQMMTELVDAKRVLEIGTSDGYSSLWIGKGLRATGGKLDTVEYDEGRAAEAKENFRKTGFDDIITLHVGDGFKVIPEIEGEFDLIFLDAWKPDYKKFFDITFPKLKPGGVFLAHNAISSADKMKDFLDAVQNHPDLITNVVQMGGDGFAVSFRKRCAEKKEAGGK